MTVLGISVSGVFDVEKALAGAAAQINLAARANVGQAAAELIRDAQSNFQGAHRKGEPHVGGPQPNIVTGNLRRSILATGMRPTSTGGWTTEVGPTAKYGRRVELGFGGRGAYPYFGPAAARLRPRMEYIAAQNWARYVTF